MENVLEHFPGPSLEGCWSAYAGEETCVCPKTCLIREVTGERGLKMARFYQSGVRVPRSVTKESVQEGLASEMKKEQS